jgi:hypothetical protein
MNLSMSRIASTLIICLALLFGTGAVAKNVSKRAVALKLEAFRDGFRLCSREAPKNITAYWEVGEVEVTRIDQACTTYGGEYLHHGLFEMAAAYAFHVAENQPFLEQ